VCFKIRIYRKYYYNSNVKIICNNYFFFKYVYVYNYIESKVMNLTHPINPSTHILEPRSQQRKKVNIRKIPQGQKSKILLKVHLSWLVPKIELRQPS